MFSSARTVIVFVLFNLARMTYCSTEVLWNNQSRTSLENPACVDWSSSLPSVWKRLSFYLEHLYFCQKEAVSSVVESNSSVADFAVILLSVVIAESLALGAVGYALYLRCYSKDTEMFRSASNSKLL
jgi:hypothetical protein